MLREEKSFLLTGRYSALFPSVPRSLVASLIHSSPCPNAGVEISLPEEADKPRRKYLSILAMGTAKEMVCYAQPLTVHFITWQSPQYTQTQKFQFISQYHF